MVPQSDQVHYGGSTGTLEIPSSSRPLNRKSVAQTSESYDQSERDTMQITENINPMYNNLSGPINLVAQQMIASNSAVNQVPPSPLNPPPVMPIADSNQNLPYPQSELHHAYAPFAPQQGVTEEANGKGFLFIFIVCSSYVRMYLICLSLTISVFNSETTLCLCTYCRYWSWCPYGATKWSGSLWWKYWNTWNSIIITSFEEKISSSN